MCENCNQRAGTCRSGLFPKTAKLRRSAEFKKVFNAHRRGADDVLFVWGVENGLERSRLGLSVSRKVGNAVVRNRWKRLIREAFRKNRTNFPVQLDLVVLPQKGAKLPTARQVETSLLKLVKRLTRTVSRSTGSSQSPPLRGGEETPMR